MLSKISQTQKNSTKEWTSHTSSFVVLEMSSQTQSGLETAGARGGGMGGCCLMGTEILFGVMKKFWR